MVTKSGISSQQTLGSLAHKIVLDHQKFFRAQIYAHEL